MGVVRFIFWGSEIERLECFRWSDWSRIGGVWFGGGGDSRIECLGIFKRDPGITVFIKYYSIGGYGACFVEANECFKGTGFGLFEGGFFGV